MLLRCFSPRAVVHQDSEMMRLVVFALATTACFGLCGSSSVDTDVAVAVCKPQFKLSNVADRVCGNGVCQLGESCSSCAHDCGACPLLLNMRMSVSVEEHTLPNALDDLPSPNRRRLNAALGCGPPPHTGMESRNAYYGCCFSRQACV